MPSIAIIAPNVAYYVNNLCGVSNVGGFMITRDALTGAPRPTYNGPEPIPAKANPTVMKVGNNGAVLGPNGYIFWETGDGVNLYTVETVDPNGVRIQLYQNYPITGLDFAGGGNIITTNNIFPNYVCNPQLYYWSRGTSFDNTTLPVGTTQIADTWFFRRSNTDATIQIQEYSFSAGENIARDNPSSAWQYTVSVASADGEQDLMQFYGDVQTFSGASLFFAIDMQTLSLGSTATVELICEQNFGTGGSPTIQTALDSFVVTDSMTTFTSSPTIPSISGNALGDQDSSYFTLFLRFDPTAIQDVIGTSVQLQDAPGTGLEYPYLPPKEEQGKILNNQLLGPDAPIGASLIGYTDTETVRDALDNVVEHNFLIGWDFRVAPRQLGPSNTASTFYPNNDASYVADQTVLLSDGDDIVDIAGVDILTMTVNTAATKFGVLQKITARDTLAMVQKGTVSLRASISQTSANSNTKIAVVAIAGPADAQGIDIVSTWNGDNVAPTLAAGWSYLQDQNGNTFSSITGTISSSVDVEFENLTIPVGTINMAVFIWSDTINLVASDEVSMLYAQLNIGETASPIEVLSEQETLQKCQQFVFKTYAGTDVPTDLPADNSPVETANPSYITQTNPGPGLEVAVAGGACNPTYTLPVSMFTGSSSLSARIFNPFTGTENSARNEGNYVNDTVITPFSQDVSVTNIFSEEGYFKFQTDSFLINEIPATPDFAMASTFGDGALFYQAIVTAFLG